MYVNHSGWSVDRGSFSYNVFIDESKLDYAVEYGNGFISKQMSPFQHVTGDWNHDGDVYEQYGAWFQSEYGGNSFFTPEDLVRIAADDALEPDRRIGGNEARRVHGVVHPMTQDREPLDRKIADSERRAANQEADRNRRMNELGIRPSNEPRAR